MKKVYLFMGLAFSIAAKAQVSFQQPAKYTVDDNPRTMAVGDFDEDGFIDIVTGNGDSDSENLSILINDQTGGFTDRTDIDLSNAPYEVTAADVNGDTHLDIAVTIYQDDLVAVLLGDGEGSFGTPTYFTTGTDTQPYGLVIGNFNSDSNPDIITANRDGDNVSLLTGDGTGNFSAPSHISVGQSPWDIVAGYFDADSHLDIATVNTVDDNITVLIGNGAGGFPTTNTISGVNNIDQLELADLNNDGKHDITGTGSSTFFTCLGDGLGSFGSLTFLSYCEGPGDTGDLDGDGNDDAVFYTRDFAIYTALGDGNGTLAYDVKYRVESGAQGNIRIRDVDNDGDLDLLVLGYITSAGVHQVIVLKNDGSGYFDAPAQYPILPLEGNYEGAYAIVRGDFNEDGEMDLAATSHEDDQLVLLFGDGLGKFTIPVAFATGDDPRDLLTGYFNEDDHLDLITLNWGSDNMSLHLGDGAGDFTGFTSIATSSTAFHFDTAKFNNDDHLDIIVAGGTGNNIGFFAGDGMGGFASPDYTALASSVYDVRAIDANEDGNMDIAASYNSLGDVAIYLGNGAGVFTDNGSYDTGNASWIEHGNINNDSHTDLLIANSSSVLLSNGDGTYTIQTISGIGGTTHMNSADMNMNGEEEIIRSTQSVSSSFGEGEITVYDLDNTLSIEDQWTSGNGSTGGFKSVVYDFNHDDLPDIASTDVNYNGIWIHLNNSVAICESPDIVSDTGNPSDLCVGDNAAMTITATGSNLEYQWYKDSSPISGAQSSSLNFDTEDSSDAGSYKVEVSNSCGSDDHTFTLTINETPSAPVTTDQEGCEEESIILSATGGSNGNYQWYEDETGDSAISGEVNETFTTPTLSSTTTYYVSLRNGNCESARSDVTAEIMSSVNISSQPSDQIVDLGEAVNFSLAVSGDNLSFQWQKDEEDISGATLDTYSIASAQPSDEGNYRCVVSNDCGQIVSQEATLAINTGGFTLDLEPIESLIIYPNPANKIVSIEGLPLENEWVITFTDLTGQIILRKLIAQKNSRVDVSSLSKGIYWVSISFGNKKWAGQKVIIK